MHPGVPERPEQHHRSPGAPGVQLLPGRRRGTRTPPSTGTRPRQDRSRIPYGRPPPRYDRPGVRKHGTGSTSLPVPATRPPVPTSSCGGAGGLIRYIPRGRHGGPGLPAVRVRRTGAPRHTGAPGGRRDTAPYVPLEGRVRRVPGGARRSVPAGDVPGAPAGRTSAPYDASSPGRRGAARRHPPPRGVRHVRRAAPRRTPPAVPRRAAASGGGARGGVQRRGTPPRRPPRHWRRGERSPRRSSRCVPCPRYIPGTASRPPPPPYRSRRTPPPGCTGGAARRAPRALPRGARHRRRSG